MRKPFPFCSGSRKRVGNLCLGCNRYKPESGMKKDGFTVSVSRSSARHTAMPPCGDRSRARPSWDDFRPDATEPASVQTKGSVQSLRVRARPRGSRKGGAAVASGRSAVGTERSRDQPRKSPPSQKSPNAPDEPAIADKKPLPANQDTGRSRGHGRLTSRRRSQRAPVARQKPFPTPVYSSLFIHSSLVLLTTTLSVVYQPDHSGFHRVPRLYRRGPLAGLEGLEGKTALCLSC